MRPELEAILRAYQATKEATGEEANRLRIIYQSRLEDVLQRFPVFRKSRFKACSIWLIAAGVARKKR